MCCLSSLSQKCSKLEKPDFAMMLRESADPNVHDFQPVQKTERKWKTSRARVHSAVAAAEGGDRIHAVNKQGLGQGEVNWWPKASVRKRQIW